MAQVAYKTGEVYLCAPYGTNVQEPILKEVEVLDVSHAARAVRTNIHGWIDAAAFHAQVKGRLGRVEYRGWFRRRVLVKEA